MEPARTGFMPHLITSSSPLVNFIFLFISFSQPSFIESQTPLLKWSSQPLFYLYLNNYLFIYFIYLFLIRNLHTSQSISPPSTHNFILSFSHKFSFLELKKKTIENTKKIVFNLIDRVIYWINFYFF